MTEATLSADIGGTFTDVVLDMGGTLFSTKVLTNYAAPDQAIIDGMRRVCDQAGIAPGQIGRVIHGTTLATNALIERRGARTAFVTTQGFRDTVEMRTESRFEQYDLNLVLPTPLIARNHRFTLAERIDATGRVLLALDEAEVEALGRAIGAGNYESVAVGLIHSYANPAHERRVRDILTAICPGVSVSISADVSPLMREYERFNTVIANAYVRPMMERYLNALQHQLVTAGAECPIFLMHSGGGVISLRDAAAFPVRLMESGPAGGAMFAAYTAASHGCARVLAFDMGGTTAKICLIRDHTPKTAQVFEVARTYRFKKGSGMPISIPVIDMVEIGAGGGSLATVDDMRQIRVGPESAGSEPGPACYGRGGLRPAVTDADLVLGRLDPENFAGGTMTLSTEASARAITAEVGERLDLDATMAAFGISDIVDENMASAARVHAVENGEDLGDYTMIASGGAAPLHAGRLCEKLGIQRLIVPPSAGVGSAVGFLRAPFAFESTRSLFMRLDAFDTQIVRDLLASLAADATSFVRSCDTTLPIACETRVFMRYAGQGWEIPVSLDQADIATIDAATLQRLFETEYAKLFSRIIEGMPIEITVWAVNATTPRVRPEPVDPLGTVVQARPQSHRPVFDAGLERFVDAAVIARATFLPGQQIAGPCVIHENETTIIVPASRVANCRSDGAIEIVPHGA
ncbi:hydantoinase/oxoprolinase family protein [Falsirhodobacter halotolerans]|uniref:hydantoinase/oxoprolinase family protein n=1 Tax=Falsirhodobacter halotolerans TaxID=1146892 RepID=UPI001FD526A7|nr:hydantoinase/oxoprolinase family protein [Falsirhodobacter halotolerans]MCJ8138277.1 hydantoinase/oxoprolinase family protein [Falsirhodobacter halotolerans]